MEINVKRDGACSIVYVTGDVDLYSSPQLRGYGLGSVSQSRATKVILNLTEVPYVDSSGIASLVEALQEAKRQEARLILVGLNDGPRHVLELTRLLNVFEVAATEQEALA